MEPEDVEMAAPPELNDDNKTSAEMEDMKKRLKEMEDEAAALREMQTKVEKEMGSAQDPTAVAAEQANKEEVDSRSIFVGNVDYACTPEEVQQHFQSCGTVNRVTIRTNKYGLPKGYAYVEFLEAEAVQEAIRLNESELHGRQLKVLAKRTNVPGMKQFHPRRGIPFMGGRFRAVYPQPFFYPHYGYGCQSSAMAEGTRMKSMEESIRKVEAQILQMQQINKEFMDSTRQFMIDSQKNAQETNQKIDEHQERLESMQKATDEKIDQMRKETESKLQTLTDMFMNWTREQVPVSFNVGTTSNLGATSDLDGCPSIGANLGTKDRDRNVLGTPPEEMNRTTPPPFNLGTNSHQGVNLERSDRGVLNSGRQGNRDPNTYQEAIPTRNAPGIVELPREQRIENQERSSFLGSDSRAGMNRYPKLDFPVFDGLKPRSWVRKAEKYFRIFRIMEDQMIEIAVIHMKGKADVWAQGYLLQKPRVKWKEFGDAICARFGERQGMEVVEDFNKLVQTDGIEDYTEKFEELRSCMLDCNPTLPESFFVSSYISGLKDEIRSLVKLNRPNSLSMVYEQSRLHYGAVQAIIKLSSTGLQQLGPNLAANNLETRDIPATNSQLSESRRTSGLCYKCGDRYFVGHRCKNQSIYSLIATDEENVHNFE